MQVLDWLSRLIAIDTTSRNSNLLCIEMLESWFKERSIPTRITRDPIEKKANLVATLAARDGQMDGGLVLSGHTDTVPVDGQDWHTDPFQAVQKDGLVYGRGTCDMKGFLAVCLSLVPEWQQSLSHPVHMAFSYDEETGCKGAPLLIADFAKAGLSPKACIVGEPTMMKPVVAHKGIQVFRCKVTGVAAHSSLTSQGSNAIEYAARIIASIRTMADQLRADGPFDRDYDVPYTSMTTNFIKGGTAHNIIPAECEFVFEFRHLPQVAPQELISAIQNYVQQELLPEMQAENAQANIEIVNLGTVPAFESSSTVFNNLIRSTTGDHDIHKVAYATEAGLFQKAGIPTVVCGPGSIEQAHRANEFVAIAQLELCQATLRSIVRDFSL